MHTLVATSGGTLIGLAIFVLVFSVVAFLWGTARTKLNAAALQAAEAELGLPRVDAQRWHGVVDGFEVDIHLLPKRAHGDRLARTQVAVGGALPDVSFGREGLIAGLSGRGLGEVVGDDQRVGDPSFDDVVIVKGRRDAILALLDVDLRALVTAAAAEGWVFVERRWQYTATGAPSELDFTRARRGLELATAVRARGDAVLPRLVERAMHDPLEGVRRGALEALLEGYRDAPESARAFVHAQRSDVPRHRLLVSKKLHDRADLTAFVRDASLPADLRAAALDALLRLSPGDPEVRALCVWALEADIALRQVAAAALGGSAGSLAVAEADGALALAEEDVVAVP